MRLLERLPSGDLSLTSVDDDNPPPYAILSHTWVDGQEVTYQDLVAGTGGDKPGYDKIRFCVDQAVIDGLHYSWVDTCCIDKSTSDELSTAINSMFRWYQRATKCYVYLTDVDVPKEVVDPPAFQITWHNAFRRSRWFTRGWTLQELLAPASVEFFSKGKLRLGSKITLEQDIHEITKIPIEALRRQDLSKFSVEQRMAWTVGRTTSKKEDRSYCLLGIFGIFMPLIYGEGEENAMRRLQEEVARRHQGQGTESIRDVTAPLLLPFSRNELFIGREDQLRTLEQSVLAPDSHQRMTIYGLGGSGKSALALELAYRAMAVDASRAVFWVPAMSRQSFELAYREIGVCLHLPGLTDADADITKLVKDALSSDTGRPWLLIVDNIDDVDVLMQNTSGERRPARLYDYLPNSSRGKVVFTTRSRKAAESITPSNVMDLQDMGRLEAKQLLERRVTQKELLGDDQIVTELVELLTYLPLAIVQAAAFMNQNDVSTSDYISMLRETETKAELFSEHFQDPTRYQEMENTVAKTWYISFNQIRQQDPLAAEYLSFIACIDRINIPLSLLPETGSRLQQVKAIGTLKGYAFITERRKISQDTPVEKFFDMHRLVHMASAWWLDSQNEQDSWMTGVATRLEALIPDGDRDTKTVWIHYLPHAMHVAKVGDTLDRLVKASLLEQIGWCQISLGQYSACVATRRQALKLRETVLGSNHPDTLTSTSDLALSLIGEGRYREAEAISRHTLAQQEVVLGPRHPDRLACMNNLVWVLYVQGHLEEAEAISRQTLAVGETDLGPEHPLTMMAMSLLALVLGRGGKDVEAEAMTRQTLARRKTVLGLEHPDTLESMHNWAEVLRSQGEFEEAEGMSRQLLALVETVFGPEHPNMLTTMRLLSQTLADLGRYEEAEAMARQARALTHEVLEPDHPLMVSGAYNLACILDRRGKYEEAEAIYRSTSAQMERELGSVHVDTLTYILRLARLMAVVKRYDESATLYRKARAGYDKVLATITSGLACVVWKSPSSRPRGMKARLTQRRWSEPFAVHIRETEAVTCTGWDQHLTPRICYRMSRVDTDHLRTFAL